MVLDYNKVSIMKDSATESNATQDSTNDDHHEVPTSSNIRNQSLFATDQDCDIALITEEVVDGACSGHCLVAPIY